MKTPVFLLAISALLGASVAQRPGKIPERHPRVDLQVCNVHGCKPEHTSIVLDAGLRSLHKAGSNASCNNGSGYDLSDCMLEGLDYSSYAVSVENDNMVKMGYVTPVQNNVGSRIYLAASDDKYKMFHFLNQEFSFDVEGATLGCGFNAALFFAQMDEDGGKAKYPSNKVGAKYGTGYCDAQCPNTFQLQMLNQTSGYCCTEMDFWEANRVAETMTMHPCTSEWNQVCENDHDCGKGDYHYDGLCNKNGCGFNPYQRGNHTFYGPNSTFLLDSSKRMTVVTQFITDDNTANGNLIDIRRYYKQGGRVLANSAAVDSPSFNGTNALNDGYCTAAGDQSDFANHGAMAGFGKNLQRGQVLILALWSSESGMSWLDADWNAGWCGGQNESTSYLIENYPKAYVKFGNFRVGDLGTTTPGVPGRATPTPKPTKH